jgi:hypothetical protein
MENASHETFRVSKTSWTLKRNINGETPHTSDPLLVDRVLHNRHAAAAVVVVAAAATSAGAAPSVVDLG